MKQLISFYCFPDRHCYHRTDNRSHNKQPKLANSLHSGKQCRTNATGRINRCPRNGNTYNMHQYQSQSDSQSGKMRTAIIPVGSAQYSQHEDERKHRLGNKCSQQIRFFKTVGSRTLYPHCPGNQPQQCRAKYSARHLRYDIHTGFHYRQSAIQPNADGDGRIDMTARNRTDCVRHCHHRQTERESNRQHRGYRCRAAIQYSSAASH